MYYDALYPHSTVFLGNKVTWLQISVIRGDYFFVIGIKIKLWRILFELNGFCLLSTRILHLLLYNARIWRSQSSAFIFFCFLFYQICNVGT